MAGADFVSLGNFTIEWNIKLQNKEPKIRYKNKYLFRRSKEVSFKLLIIKVNEHYTYNIMQIVWNFTDFLTQLYYFFNYVF